MARHARRSRGARSLRYQQRSPCSFLAHGVCVQQSTKKLEADIVSIDDLISGLCDAQISVKLQQFSDERYIQEQAGCFNLDLPDDYSEEDAEGDTHADSDKDCCEHADALPKIPSCTAADDEKAEVCSIVPDLTDLPEGEADVSSDRENDDDDAVREKDLMWEKVVTRVTCAVSRRKWISAWASRRVTEISMEDESESDSEDEALKEAHMDAIGAACENAEVALSIEDLNLTVRATDDTNAVPSSVTFAGIAQMYIIKPEVETTVALDSTTGNTSWILDRVDEEAVLDRPSGPLGKWRKTRSWHAIK